MSSSLTSVTSMSLPSLTTTPCPLCFLHNPCHLYVSPQSHHNTLSIMFPSQPLSSLCLSPVSPQHPVHYVSFTTPVISMSLPCLTTTPCPLCFLHNPCHLYVSPQSHHNTLSIMFPSQPLSPPCLSPVSPQHPVHYVSFTTSVTSMSLPSLTTTPCPLCFLHNLCHLHVSPQSHHNTLSIMFPSQPLSPPCLSPVSPQHPVHYVSFTTPVTSMSLLTTMSCLSCHPPQPLSPPCLSSPQHPAHCIF